MAILTLANVNLNRIRFNLHISLGNAPKFLAISAYYFKNSAFPEKNLQD